MSLRRDALAIFRAAVRASDAFAAVSSPLAISGSVLKVEGLRFPLTNFDRVFVIAVGKAAAPMAFAVEKVLSHRLTRGLVVTKQGHGNTKLQRCEVIESSHPLPGNAGIQASSRVEQAVRELNARDLLICCVSGGASALLPSPVQGVSLAAKQITTDLLLRAGADIFELNAVRKHLSRLKGGRLASLAFPATVVSLLLSDVIGDPVDVIGSGPTAADASTFSDALSVIRTYRLLRKIPSEVRRHLEQGASGTIAETPKPGDAIFKDVYNVIVGSNRLALRAAAETARALGYRPLILSSTMRGEARDVARVHAQILRETILSKGPVRLPACLLSGGETTVTVRGPGKGGRNQEFALAAAIDIAGLPNALVLSAGTDGTDGPTDAAGAFATGDTTKRAASLGLDARVYLANNDSYSFFDRLGTLIKTGPTGTNVMDIHLLLAK